MKNRIVPVVASGLGLMLLAGVAFAAPSSAQTGPRPQVPAGGTTPPPGKALPARPPVPQGVATGSALPAKPKRAAAAAAPAAAWTVQLSASATLLWPDQYSTLTATTNMDVGPTPYYLRIYDVYGAQYVASCGAGTTCSMPVTSTIGLVLRYRAVVSDGSSSVPPATVLAASNDVDVDWRTLTDKLHLKLAAQPSTVAAGTPTVLTATTAEDVGPSPLSIEIFDSTTQRLAAICKTGFSCSVAVSQPGATTHLYAAYVAVSVTTYPDGTQQGSGTVQTAGFSYVTWAGTGWSVSLSVADSPTPGFQVLTATASSDVGPTPYYIEIFALPFDHLYARCGTGTTCVATIPTDYLDWDIQAFVTTWTDNAFPFPAGTSVQASSNLVNN